MQNHLLTILILLPVIGAATTVVYSLTPGAKESHHRWIALAFTTLGFVLSLLLIKASGGDSTAFRFEENYSWIGSIGARYHVGVDGISLWLVLLTTLLMPISVLSSWTAIKKRTLPYYVLMLILEAAMIGVFVSLDLLLFYLFFEASLVPMFFLIGIWGGERRVYASIKFFIYTAVGSLLMLVAIISLFFVYSAKFGQGSFDYTVIFDALRTGALQIPARPTQALLFAAFAIAFCIKVPLWPVHTWLPDAHTEAPTAGSVILAGVMLKAGAYGFIRFAIPLFPQVAIEAIPVFMALAVVGIIYGALVAMVQPDLKRLVAYSSVSHLGFVMLGIFAFDAQGVQGAVYQMLNHGLSTGALFLLVGMLYLRRHTREIAEFGGLWGSVPIYAGIFMLVMLSSIGLPGLNGFVGEFLILVGAYLSLKIAVYFAVTGLILGALYMMWAYERVMWGPLNKAVNAALADLSRREIAVMIPLVALMFFMGLYPRPLLNRMQ